ncbi:apolipoprotein N-acyltransferase [Coleofasciculus sp. FACHB-712]|uniref:apolipoprotein N-acyltransferase n=1 Tax=Coleofasciculus sp. FACHB-712 TaxID=2692789 RepID=UPI0016865F15|nr:apolipoprotein N-acyltransferase [Coleofasciculus sp. FACHB-712]MBD1941232.1 apolipoprotein N-acyltransferase [Coleofasciculus sp. FACHB-712]
MKKLLLIFNFAFLISLVGGILMGVTTAPIQAWPLAWIALTPLWILIVKKGELKLKKGGENSSFLSFNSPFLIGLAWGIGYHGVALSWITGIHPMTWLGVPWLASLAIAFFCWTFITLWGAGLVAIWATGMAFLCKPEIKTYSSLLRLLIGVALWCGLESLWGSGSLWWTSLSYTQSPHNLAILHLGQISGPNTVTAAIVAVNCLIAEAWINRKQYTRQIEETNSSPSSFVSFSPKALTRMASLRRFVLHPGYLSIAAGLLIGLHLLGFGLYSRPLIQPPQTALKVGIIQGNIPNKLKFDPIGWRRAIEGYTSGYKTLADEGVDAVLIPETALPVQWTEPSWIRDSFLEAILDKGVVAWIGTFGEAGNDYTNSLYTITGTGETFSRYDKTKLVPLGEFIPFEKVLGKLIDKLSPLDAHLIPGKTNQIFDTPFGRAIVGICYDSAFPELFRRQAAAGGQFILTASNDAHYTSSMMAQHHAQDLMRAIESDRWAVRATNTGFSGVIDPHGRTLWISKMNTYQLHVATIYRRQTQTLYVRWGDWLTPLLLVLGAIAWFFTIFWRDNQRGR